MDAAHPNAARRSHPWTGRSGGLLQDFLSSAEPGARRLSGIRVDGRLVAYSFDLLAPGYVATYYASYSAEVAHCGVGTYLENLVRVRAAESGTACFDLLRGLQPYKHRVATQQHLSCRLQIMPPGVLRTRHGWLVASLIGWRQMARRSPQLLRTGRRLTDLRHRLRS